MVCYLLAVFVALANTGAEWLEKIDSKATVRTAHMILDLDVIDKKGTVVSRKMEIWQKGDQSRLIRLQEPVRLKGIGLLVLDEDSLHLFLPQYPPARRVLNSKRSDAFLGTDFAIDDLARLSYATQYTAKYINKEGQEHHLELHPLDTSVQTTVQLWCNDNGNVIRVEHYNSKGNLSRKLIFTDYKSINGVELAHELSVEDVIKNRQTIARMTSAEINSELSSEIFSLNNLENP
jgi:hypothetical protein